MQAKLTVNRPGDRHEQEADRVADIVMRMPGPLDQQQAGRKEEEEEGTAQAKPVNPQITPLIQRRLEPQDDEKEASQLPHGALAVAGKAQARINALRGGGDPLPQSAREFFEPRFGVDFSRTRIHTGALADEATRSLNARAFTLGRDIFFGSGEFQPGTQRGDRLLAHELTHTVQQAGQGSSPSEKASATHIYREPKGEEPEEQPGEDEVYVNMVIGIDPEVSPEGFGEEGGVIDLTRLAKFEIFEGDVFTLTAESDFGELAATWTLPPELEKVQDIDSSGIQLRVVGNPGTDTPERTVLVKLTPQEAGKPISVLLKLGGLPQRPDAVNPELAENQRNILNLRQIRKEKRRQFRKTRRQAQQKARQERKQRRVARRGERQSFHRQARKLRKQRRQLDRADSCGLDTEAKITQALSRANLVASAAIRRLQDRGVRDRGVQYVLEQVMKRPPGTNAPTGRDQVVQKAIDVLSIARNSLLAADHTTFQCGSLKCDEETGALVMGERRGETVFLCIRWIRGNLRFGVGGGNEDARAYALLHEFVHLAGIIADAETYVHKEGEWKALDHKSAMQMADAYARVAWQLGA